MTCKPKEFRRFKPKPKKSREQWRSGRLIKKGKDMRELRQQAFARSDGYCEKELCEEKKHAQGCPGRIFWDRFDLHHILSRGRGGSDTLENVACLSRECHLMEHGERKAA